MAYYHGGNGSKNYFTKKASQPLGNLVVFQILKNNDFNAKNMKNT